MRIFNKSEIESRNFSSLSAKNWRIEKRPLTRPSSIDLFKLKKVSHDSDNYLLNRYSLQHSIIRFKHENYPQRRDLLSDFPFSGIKLGYRFVKKRSSWFILILILILLSAYHYSNKLENEIIYNFKDYVDKKTIRKILRCKTKEELIDLYCEFSLLTDKPTQFHVGLVRLTIARLSELSSEDIITFLLNQMSSSSQQNIKYLIFMLAQYFYTNHNFEGAAYLCNELLKSNSEDSLKFAASLILGVICMINANWDHAIPHLKKALRYNVTSQLAIQLMGFLFEEGFSSERLAYVHNNLGVCYKNLNVVDKALDHFEKVFVYLG